MKKLAWLLLIAAALMFVVVGCGSKPKVEDEGPTVMTHDDQGNMNDQGDNMSGNQDEPVEPMATIDFQTIYFDFDKYNLKSDAKQSLQYNYNLMKENPDLSVLIEGNCDERGTVEYNLALGEKRARSAMDYLVNLGADPGRISIISYGKERPAVMGHDEAAWAKNRRCDFVVTGN